MFFRSNRTLFRLLFAGLALLVSWLLLFPLRGLKFLGSYSIYLGRNPSIHVLIGLALLFYLYLIIYQPELSGAARKQAASDLKTTLPNVLGALLLAGAAVELIPHRVFAMLLGETAGYRAIFSGVGLGVILPACPFVAYPVIGTLYSSGVISFTATMALLFGQGIGFVCVLTADHVFFNFRVSALRIGLSTFSALLAAILLYQSGIQP